MRISDIRIGNRRKLKGVEELASSIKEIGLLNPVTINSDNSLIAGHHRIEAFKLLGFDEIPATVIDCTALQAELAEIDENLIRNDLTALQQGIQLKRRKDIYLELHPETKNGGDRVSGDFTEQNEAASFCSDTANKTGQTTRTIEIKTKIGALADIEEDIEAAGIEDSQKDLTALAKLQAKEPEQVAVVLEAIKSGESKTVKGALLKIEADNKADASAIEIKENKPIIHHADFGSLFNMIDKNSMDLLITDPPYSTDIDDIEGFVDSWLFDALDKVKQEGRAYICIGAYPNELMAYLNKLSEQTRFIVDNPLIWTYRNTLGVTPKNKYNLNYQVILHLYTDESPELDTSITNEMFSVQDINAPDGRQGDRYHAWQKPDELAMRLIRHGSKAGDKVFDPFTCTGTFPIAASKLGRIAIGCDISEDNLKIAEKRGCDVVFQ